MALFADLNWVFDKNEDRKKFQLVLIDYNNVLVPIFDY